ncbi:hypothetical protein GQR58_026405 [Nymphon striatum]|nr:hypothetical protein GQR58_026405 [Nymphon striatum]
MRKHILTILTLLVVSIGFSQEEVTKTNSFTLEEAIDFALENNYSAINAGRDLLDAKKQKWETIATGLPQITGGISYQNQLKQPVSVIPAEIFGGEPGTFAEVVFGQPQSANATATLKQQIFDGSYIVGVQATKAFLSYSQNNKEKTDLEVRKAVTEAYGNVLLAKESDEESVEQLQITLSSVDNQLKNAIRLKSITLQMLNLVMGIAIDAPTVLEENLDDLAQNKIDFGLLESEFNMENNVDFKLATNLNQQRLL